MTDHLATVLTLLVASYALLIVTTVHLCRTGLLAWGLGVAFDFLEHIPLTQMPRINHRFQGIAAPLVILIAGRAISLTMLLVVTIFRSQKTRNLQQQIPVDT